MSCSNPNCTCGGYNYTNYSNCGTPKLYVDCCTVMSCINIASSNNSVTVTTSDCGVDLVITGNNLDNIFNLVDDECITYTKEFIDGVLTYTAHFNEDCLGDATAYTADRGIVENVSHNFRLVESLDGAATKFLWNYPKAAFRAGETSGTQWNVANTGRYSAAVGHDTIASGISSFSGGETSSATGVSSFAYGTSVVVAADNSTGFGLTLSIGSAAVSSVLIGHDMSSTQKYSAGFGRTNSIDATTALAISLGQSFVAGAGLHAHGQNNIILGGTSTTNNDFDIAIGLDHELNANYCYAFGRNLLSSALSCVVTGIYNDAADEADDTVEPGTFDHPTFIVGNGHITGSPPSEVRTGKNGLIVYQSGTVRIKGALDQRDSVRGIIPARWITANRPASPIAGEFGYNTTANKLEYWNASTWVQLP